MSTSTQNQTSDMQPSSTAASFKDLSREEFLSIVKPLVTDPAILTRYKASENAPHLYEDRLAIGATCFGDRPFTVIGKSDGLVKQIEVHLFLSRAPLEVDALMVWFTVFRQYAPYLSGKVHFGEKRCVHGIHDGEEEEAEQDDETNERYLIRRITRAGMDMYAKLGPVVEVDDLWEKVDDIWERVEDVWEKEDWVYSVWRLIKLQYNFPDSDRVRQLYPGPHWNNDGNRSEGYSEMEGLLWHWPWDQRWWRGARHGCFRFNGKKPGISEALCWPTHPEDRRRATRHSKRL
ncbi:hypothetical protein BDZ85DRAFT_299086 [Elsinoe ampelina]|uniref:Uncharacterized protein n=1 Tax=Elsinoe ampelina TaxID=302913 RepID=A0A6A6G0B2_9PEZI|nr:hypothetical protein BDZ85DRAFT_299086 [Elsinoe ampelina]